MNTRSSASSATRRRRDEARDLFRSAILDAAEAVFAEKGYPAARIQDIARHARIAVGTVYNHFVSKEEVLAELLDERAARLAELIGTGPPARDAGAFAVKLEDRVRKMLAYTEEHRGFFEIVMGYGLSGPAVDPLGPRAKRRIERFSVAWRRFVEEGISCGALLATDPANLAAFLGGTIRSLTQSALRDKSERLVDKVPVIVSLFLHGAARVR